MHHRGLLLVFSLVGVVGVTWALGQLRDPAAPEQAAAQAPVHGLRANFYAVRDGTYTVDDFNIPTANRPPDATRIDPQIAFGRGKGFDASKGQLIWWQPKEHRGHVMVVWKGYIHLPKAGTYYVTTISNNSSAVYLNESRVAVNGGLGGAIPTYDFSYGGAAPDLERHGARHQYLHAVTADSSRDLPIEVRFLTQNAGEVGFGIDLMWVTPDSPRDPKTNKPIAQLVPAEALYVEPPRPIAKPTVRGANSTISSDHLDLPSEGENYATLMIRLADKDGRPVAGHRVHVAGVVSYDYADVIVQPEKPTDANGITTAKVRASAWGYAHESRFFATDVTDLVDVAQVLHVRTVRPPSGSFFPNTFGRYYDGKNFVLSPLPLRVGQATIVTVPMTNRLDDPYELRVRISVQGWNIGGPNWKPVGETEPFVLKPKESREAKVVWTPQKEDTHVCFKVDVLGRRLKPGAAAALRLLGVSMALAADAPKEGAPLDSRQQNVGPVGGEPPKPRTGPETDVGDQPLPVIDGPILEKPVRPPWPPVSRRAPGDRPLRPLSPPLSPYQRFGNWVDRYTRHLTPPRGDFTDDIRDFLFPCDIRPDPDQQPWECGSFAAGPIRG